MPKQPRALKEEEVLEIYDAYMDGRLVDKARYGTIDTMIEFIGVWDTVGALAFGRTLGNFHRINPGNVKRVAHALALDEERQRFEPSFWDPPATAATQVDEVWFSGCHTNIGGGYVDANLPTSRYSGCSNLRATPACPSTRAASPASISKIRAAFSAIPTKNSMTDGPDRRYRRCRSTSNANRAPSAPDNESIKALSIACKKRPANSPTSRRRCLTVSLIGRSNPGIQPWGGF